MGTKLEQVIQLHLKAGRSADELARELSKKIIAGQLSWDDRLATFDFFWNGGFDRIALQTAAHLAMEKQRLPFGHMLETIARNGSKPGKTLLAAWIKGVRKQDAQELMDRTKSWDQLDEKIVEIHRSLAAQRKQRMGSQRETLFEKLGFFRAQRMIQEEEKLLGLLKRLFPNDTQVSEEAKGFEERWARHVLAEKGPNWSSAMEGTQGTHSPDEIAIAEVIMEFARHKTAGRPEAAYQFAMAFLFMEFYNFALEMLEQEPMDMAADWLYLELLLYDRRFVDALAHIQNLEIRYAMDPETNFSCTYMRAKALQGLGQTSQAIELLRGLVRVRPNYRSAQTLLLDWSGGQGP